MFEAAFWGAIGASTLLLGAVLAFAVDVPARLRGLILAFGAGALFGAVAYELFDEAIEVSIGGLPVAIGFALGATAFYVGSLAIDRMGASAEDQEATSAPAAGSTAPGRIASRRKARTDGLAVLLGTVLDGIPESIVLGASLIAGGSVGVPVFVAIAVSNVPEGLSATKDLRDAGFTRRRIVNLWMAVVVASAAAAGVGLRRVARGRPERHGIRRCLRGWGDPDDAGRVDDSRGPRDRRPGGRSGDRARVRGRVVAIVPRLMATAMSSDATAIVEALGMRAHPEGGWYVETWRAEAAEPGGRPSASAILFLLAAGERSHWHRVDAAEIWQWSGGAPLELRIHADGATATYRLGGDVDDRGAAAGSRPSRCLAGSALAGCLDPGRLHRVAGLRFRRVRVGAPGMGADRGVPGSGRAARGVAPLDRAREAVAERRAQAAGHIPGPATHVRAAIDDRRGHDLPVVAEADPGAARQASMGHADERRG